jgi:predicted phage terminase large subunit-like protein
MARREARRSMVAWMKYRGSPFEPALHHRLIIAELERIESGANDRLMLLLPPGSAKSTYGSVEFPAWYVGKHPTDAVIVASNTSDLAERFSRRVRNIVLEEKFRDVFQVGVAEDYGAAGKWDTDRGGEYYAAGVGTTIAGRRADLAIIDDPVKSREDADSERSREKQWDWYVNDLLTRMKPKSAIILIMTRWHEDDLGGRILEREADKWKVIKIPMEAVEDDPLGRAPGERLWGEWYTDEMMELAKQDLRSWNALYQQNPHSEEGSYFKAEWLNDYDSVPSGLRIYASSDFAVTDGSGDFTEHGVIGIDSSGNGYVLDWWRGQKSADFWIEKMADLIEKWSPSCWFAEAGPIRRSVEPFMMKRLSDRGAFCRIEWMTSINDKESRARGIQAFMSMGKLYWPKFAPWKTDVQSQLLRFPTGKHDDAVDVLSLFGRGMKYVNSSKKPVRKRIFQPIADWMAG